MSPCLNLDSGLQQNPGETTSGHLRRRNTAEPSRLETTSTCSKHLIFVSRVIPRNVTEVTKQTLTSEMVEIDVPPPVEVDRLAVVAVAAGHRYIREGTSTCASLTRLSQRHTALHYTTPVCVCDAGRHPQTCLLQSAPLLWLTLTRHQLVVLGQSTSEIVTALD